MIQKPPSDWQRGATRLEYAVETAASLARQSEKVARTGGHVGKAVLFFGFALLWGFCALGSLAFGLMPMAFGVGLMAAAMAWGGMRSVAAARGETPAIRHEQAPMNLRPAREVRYSRGRLLTAIAGGIFLAWFASHLVHGTRAPTALLMVICMLAGSIFSLLAAIKILGAHSALAWTDQEIMVSTLSKRRTVAREDVLSIALTTRTYYLYGVIPTGRTTKLSFRTRGSGNFSVASGLLSLGGSTIAQLAAELEHWRVSQSQAQTDLPARSFGRPVTSSPAPSRRHESDGAFDVDEVMARYLAEKASDEAIGRNPAPSARAAGFGRKFQK